MPIVNSKRHLRFVLRIKTQSLLGLLIQIYAIELLSIDGPDEMI